LSTLARGSPADGPETRGLTALNICLKLPFVSTTPHATKQRLLGAAAQLFAERGFHGTKIRDIADRARVNLAAAHYHYGSKRDLYLEVLRAQFAEIRALLAERGVVRSAQELGTLSRRQLAELLRARTIAMLDMLIGSPPGLHGTLMHREMLDPSEALPVIVGEFIVPMIDELGQIVSHLAPALTQAEVERCVFSVVAQALFYRSTMPAMLHLLGRKSYPRGTSARLADHITTFSLGGMEHLAAGGANPE
jgi:AcrR family transcriptional regulator